MKKNHIYFKCLALGATMLLGFLTNAQVTTFDYTGGMQTYVVPTGVTEIQFDVKGAQGGDISGTTVGWGGSTSISTEAGNGGQVTGILPVTPGETLYLFVGGAGMGSTGGYNGGGNAPSCGGSEVISAGGGGASDIRQGGTTLSDRTVVAGGGGGASGNGAGPYKSTANSGAGGGLIGQSGAIDYGAAPCLVPSGGSPTTGGTGGNNSCWCSTGLTAQSGSFGLGGSSICAPSGLSTCACDGTGCTSGGGGGGGHYGGGAGICYSGGAGGSSYTAPGATNVVHIQGANNGNGQIVLTILCNPINLTVSDYAICIGESVTIDAQGEGTITWDMGIQNNVAFEPASAGIHTYTSSSDNVNDCSVSVEIEVFELPTVTIDADNTQLCNGDAVIIDFVGTANTYDWLPVDLVEGQPYTPSVGITTFTLTGTDVNGCTNDATIDVEVADIINGTVSVTNELAGNDGEIDVTITGGFPPYTFDWNNDGTGDFDDTEDLTGLSEGTYILVVQDSEGCEGTIFVDVALSHVGITELNGKVLSVYPNPITDHVFVSFEGSFNYELIGLNGERITSGTSVDNQKIDVSNLADGVYFINVRVDNKVETIKVVKK